MGLARARPRAADTRELIAKAIAPIWEANHVWLILIIVLLFVCFPGAFAAISTALHIPLTLVLIGIVLRGSAFTFRAYDPTPGAGARRWSRVFAISSLLTPVALGVTLGAISGGHFTRDPITGLVETDFIRPWFAPYPLAVGLFTLALFAFLAAVYLIRESSDPELKAIFRRRAFVTGLVVGATAALAYFAAGTGAPVIREGLASSAWAVPLHILTGAAAITALVALARKRDRLARLAAIAQGTLIVAGWAFAQYPYLAVPGYTITGEAAPAAVLWPVLVALGIGAIALVPALLYLFAVFKRRTL